MPSFDVASKLQWNEVENALQQANKEIVQRFDFKDTQTEVERTKDAIIIRSASEDRARAAWDVIQEKLVKRKVSLRFFEAADPVVTGKGGSRIDVTPKEGIDADHSRKLVSCIKESKLKVQASIQEMQLRIAGKNRDDLQKAIALLRGQDFGIELQFINFRE
jgi:cyclic-di-GMP-binding protein